MDIRVDWIRNHQIDGRNEDDILTSFDSHSDDSDVTHGASPMSVMLQSLPACSAMDVVDILHKKRKTIIAFSIDVHAERAADHPRVFTSAHLRYKLTSDDASHHDVMRSIELSQDKYCSVSAMFKQSGCAISWELVLHRSDGTVVEP